MGERLCLTKHSSSDRALWRCTLSGNPQVDIAGYLPAFSATFCWLSVNWFTDLAWWLALSPVCAWFIEDFDTPDFKEAKALRDALDT
jgi:hypothetical protein